MKKIMSTALILALSLGMLAGCSASAAAPQQDEGRLSVVTTIFPPYDFVRQVAGDAVNLTMLLPPGAESHSFEPSPQDIITIQNCDVFLYTGGESDVWIEDILASMDTSNMTVLPMLGMVDAVPEELVEGMEGGHDHEAEDHDHDEAAEYDEHVWTSPKNAKIIVQGICDALSEKNAANADAYKANTAAYLEQLDALDAQFQQVVDGAARRTVIFGDRFPFRYLADAYGLTYYAAFPGCSTETEPSAGTIAFLIDKVKEEGIPVVFHIELSNEKMADTICEDTGAKKLLLHSCHNVTREEMDTGVTYLSLMEQNVQTLKEALT